MIAKWRFLLLAALLPAHGQEPPRIISHLAQPRGLFDTWVFISNDTLQPQKYTLSPFDQAGNPLPEVAGEVPLLSIVKLKSTQLFEDPGASHFLIEGQVNVTIGYQSPMYETVQAFVTESTRAGLRFRIFPSDWNRFFDGLAMVNLGTEPALVTLSKRNFAFEILEEDLVDGGLEIPPMGKKLIILGDPFGNGFQYLPETYVDVISDQPLAITALSADLPMNDRSKMWILDYLIIPEPESARK